MINMLGRVSGNRDAAYLKGAKFTGVGDGKAPVRLDLVSREFTLGIDVGMEWTAGVYYLVDGLDISGISDEAQLASKYFALSGLEGLEGFEVDLQLKDKTEEGKAKLALRIRKDDPGEWRWEGSEGGTWTQKGDNPTKNWTKEDPEGYASAEYHFDAAGADESGGEVTLGDGIEAGSIVVESGTYKFRLSGREGLTTEKFQVGLEEAPDSLSPANVTVDMATRSIKRVELYNKGTFTVGDSRAIQQDVNQPADSTRSTQIVFRGGTFGYGEDEGGALEVKTDYSGQVDYEESTRAVRVRVGSDGEMGVGIQPQTVEWSGSITGNRANRGIKLAVEKGIIKTGRQNFTLTWKTDSGDGASNDFGGTIESQGGLLTLKADGAGAQVRISGGSGESAGDPVRLAAGKKGTVELLALGKGSGLTIARQISGEGTIVIGSADAQDQGSYAMTEAVSDDFTGVIRLAGNGTSDTVEVETPGALGRGEGAEAEEGDHGSTLQLAGRAIVVAGGSAGGEEIPVVEAGKIAVSGVNFVGGYDEKASAENQAIKLKATGGVTAGSGDILANAQGGYHNALEGDLSGFGGVIVAGYLNRGAAGESESSWTLEGVISDRTSGAAATTIGAALAGTGRIIVKYREEETPASAMSRAATGEEKAKIVRLTGHIGDTASNGMGDKVSLENAMEGGIALVIADGRAAEADQNSSQGALIFHDNEIWLGDEEGTGSWSGAQLTAADGSSGGVFRLRYGTLRNWSSGHEISKGAGVRMVVDTAKLPNGSLAMVNVNHAAGSLFDEIIINEGGRLRDVEGHITVGEAAGRMHLTLTEANIGTGREQDSANYLITSTGRLNINNTINSDAVTTDNDGNPHNSPEEDYFSLDLTNGALLEVLLGNRQSNRPTYLHILSSTGQVDDKGEYITMTDDSEEAINQLMRNGTYTGLLRGVGFSMSVDGGDLVLNGSSADIYIVIDPSRDPGNQGDDPVIDSRSKRDILRSKQATLLDEGTALTIKLGTGEGYCGRSAMVRNLVGLGGSLLLVDGEGTVTLENALRQPDPLQDDQWLTNKVNDPQQAHLSTLQGQDTTFDGTIKGAEGVNFLKTGGGVLTVGNGTGGGLEIGGTLTLRNGGVKVRGSSGSLGSLVFDYNNVENPKDPETGNDVTEAHGFKVDGGQITVGSLIEAVPADGSQQVLGNVVELGNNARMTLGVEKSAEEGAEEGEEADAPENKMTLLNTTFTAAEGSAGTLELLGDLVLGSEVVRLADSDRGEERTQETHSALAGDVNVGIKGTLALQGKAKMDAGEVKLDGEATVLDMSGLASDNMRHEVASLTGNGKLVGGSRDLQLLVNGTTPATDDGVKDSFSGTLHGTGSLTVEKDAELRFKGMITGGTAEDKWNLTVKSGATLDVTPQAGRKASLGDVTLQDGANLIYRCSAEVSSSDVEVFDALLKVTAAEGTEEGKLPKANLTVDVTDFEFATSDRLALGGLRWDATIESDIRERFADLKLQGQGSQYFDGYLTTTNDENNYVIVDLNHVQENRYTHPGQEKNAAAGARIFWGVDDPLSATGQSLRKKVKDGEQSDLYNFATALSAQYNATKENGGNYAALDRMLAAGAGSSISVLGQALSDDLHRQLSAIRNRTTGMGSEARYEQYDEFPLYHMWVNAETGYHKMDADSFAPGYSLNSWGGTIGLELDMSRRTTVGLALSALYGDLKTDAPDSASGDIDTTYMSAFLRSARGAWSHTLVLSGGMADVKLNRTVSYGYGAYKASGSTDGYVVGALYELGYTRLSNAAGTVALQPVFNVEVRHAGLQGYNESSSDAGLRVDDISQDTVTFGVGARLQALTGTNIFNRSALFESRALLKVDAGDRSGKAVTAVLHSPQSAELESAEVGALGVEIGAGLSVPLGGSEGSVFLDASLEWRKGYVSMDASLGYRVNF